MTKKSLGRVPTSTVFNGMAKQDGDRILTNPSLVKSVNQGHEVAAAKIGDATEIIPFLGGEQLMLELEESNWTSTTHASRPFAKNKLAQSGSIDLS
mmetsp:Transcript_41626/g.100223  ORF Transcript_41626/g.100223 Transcript_41626/m.100223 type:complete len:96 (-) Transcript_41626:970-1257(-)